MVVNGGSLSPEAEAFFSELATRIREYLKTARVRETPGVPLDGSRTRDLEPRIPRWGELIPAAEMGPPHLSPP